MTNLKKYVIIYIESLRERREIDIAAHIVKCSLCKGSFDRDKEPYVKTSSNRYAHAECAKEQGLNLQVVDPTNYETCIYCKQQIDKSKESYKELTKSKFSHLSCWEENKDKLSDKEKLEMYICKLYGINKLNPKMNRQIKDFIDNQGYTYSGIQKALVYYYEVKNNKFDITKTGGGLGLVPYIYQQAYNYYYAIWEAHQNQEKFLKPDEDVIKQFIPKEVKIVIPKPKRQPMKKRLFSFLDRDEVEEDNIE